jgi:hypothetical protein
MTNAIQAREEAQQAQQAANRAQGEADQAAAAATERRQAAVEATKEAEDRRRAAERAESGWRLSAAKDLRDFREGADKLLNQKVDAPGQPDPTTRGLARQYLHGGIDFDQRALLGAADPRLAELLGLQHSAGQFLLRLGEVGDRALLEAADFIECRAWQAVLSRLRLLAGEI